MKTYTLRDIPSTVHAGWKAASAIQGISMRDFCLKAILLEVQRTLKKGDKEVQDEKQEGA